MVILSDLCADAEAEQAKSWSQLGGLTVLVVLLREGERWVEEGLLGASCEGGSTIWGG